MPGPRIIVIGHAALDFVYRIAAFPPQPIKLRALDHITSGGGMAANAAAAAARLGGEVTLWSRIGEDAAGRMIGDELARFGVDTGDLKIVPGTHSATAAVIVDSLGERLIVSEDDRSLPMTPDWLPLDQIKGAGVILSDLSWIEGTRAAFERARALGVPTMVDVDLGSGRLLPEILDLTDIVISSAPAFVRFLPGADTAARLRWLVEQGVRHAGVTRGPDGYQWLDSHGTTGDQPAFAVEPVDTTGAGDAFHGAFAFGLAQGLADADCARLAAATAALKCRRLGARAGLPTLGEVEAFLASSTARAAAAGGPPTS